MTTESCFVAMTADLVDSRSSPDRAALQEQLLKGLAALNTKLRRSLTADVQLTAGDEVQVLMSTPINAMRVLSELADVVHPAQFAVGIGYGPLSTPLPTRRSSRRLPLLDGPCFHHARTALEDARKYSAWAQAEGFGPWQTPLNALLELLGNLRQGWTERQGVYSIAARTAPQKDVAQKFSVSPSVISESLKGARFDLLRRGEAGVEALLRHFAASPKEHLVERHGVPARESTRREPPRIRG